MTMIAPLLALALPQGTSDVPPTAYLAWEGWRYLQGASATPAPAYEAGDWKPPVSASGDVDAPAWRVKFVVFSSVERTGRDANGIVRAERETIEDNQLAVVQSAISRFGGFFGPFARFNPETTVETETMRFPLTVNPVDQEFMRRYLGPRVNGGGYEPEDKKYRGPYHSIVMLFPAGVQPSVVRGDLYGMPVSAMSIEEPNKAFAPGTLEHRIAEAIRPDVAARAQIHLGAKPTDAGTWTELVAWVRPAPDVLASRLNAAAPGVDLVESLPEATWRTPYTEVAVVDDETKGKVVKLSMRGPTRAIGISLPKRSDSSPLLALDGGQTLSLTLRTLAREPLALRIEDREGKRAWLPLGREIALTAVSPPPAAPYPINTDGTWQTVRLPVAEVAKAANLSDISLLAFEFSPNARLTTRVQAQQIELFLSDVSLSSEPPTTPEAAVEESERLAALASAATSTSPELLEMLRGQNGLVRLNAAEAYTRIKDPQAVEPLAQIAIGAFASSAEAALRALAHQGGELAEAGIRRCVRFGISPHARGVAANILAETSEKRSGAELVSLLSNQSWLARLAGVEALAKIPGREAAILRLAFLAQENPEIKLAVTRNVAPSDEAQVRRLLWSAVNEPQDLVRAESAIKLIQSPVAELRTEGYKAVRDESATARILVIDWMAAHPAPEHREALRLGLADRNAPVRAAAVRAFGALETGIATEDLAGVAGDADPDVSLALAEYGRRHALPADVVGRLKSSPFAKVREVAAGIAQ
jgi:HEAT repeat protein